MERTWGIMGTRVPDAYSRVRNANVYARVRDTRYPHFGFEVSTCLGGNREAKSILAESEKRNDFCKPSSNYVSTNPFNAQ